MTSRDRPRDRREPPHEGAGAATANPIDFPFLDSQTDGDRALQDEVLQLFLSQARRLIPTLPRLSTKEQNDVAHLLKGSACGIGASAIAEATAAYETADAIARPARFQRLSVAFERVEVVIEARLAETHVAGTPLTATI